MTPGEHVKQRYTVMLALQNWLKHGGLLPKQVPQMTPEEHGKLWYDFIVEFAHQLLLISGGGDTVAAANARLERLVLEASQVGRFGCFDTCLQTDMVVNMTQRPRPAPASSASSSVPARWGFGGLSIRCRNLAG